MPSNAQKGNYYRKRTVDWLVDKGYAVAQLEMQRRVHRPGGPPLFVKRDQLGCDLLAVSAEHTLFVQVKFCGREDRRFQLDLQAAREEFAKYPCPPGARQVILVWTRGARAPRSC